MKPAAPAAQDWKDWLRPLQDHGKWLGILAVVAAVGSAILFGHHASPANPLIERVNSFQARDQEQDVRARHQDVEKKIEELAALVNEPKFNDLLQAKQDFVRGRLRELRAYRDYRNQLGGIANPRAAQGEDELKKIRNNLNGLQAPSEYLVEWSQTEAGERHSALLKEAQALETAALDVRSGYQKLIEDGTRVVKEKDKLDLPGRARAVLDRAKELPSPEQPIPGVEGMTHATVFQFPTIANLYQQWKKSAATLQSLAMP